MNLHAALHVVHLSTVHDRGDVRIYHKQCRSLAAAGYHVTLVVADGAGPQTLDGIDIVDLGRRSDGRLARMTLLPWRAFRLVRSLRPALLHVHDPELLPMAWMLSCCGVSVVYDAHEDVPLQILAKHWIPRALRRPLSAAVAVLESFLAGRLRAVVVANPPNLARFKAEGCDVVCIANYPLLSEFPAPDLERRRERKLAYVGGLTRARGVVHLVQAMALMPGVRLLLCGRFTDDGAEASCRNLPGWRQVDYLGHVDRAGIQRVLQEAEVGVVTLLPEPNYLVALPVKMFEYMAAALPVVASDIPLWRKIIDSHRCGVTVDPADPSAIATAVLNLLSAAERHAMGLRGREAVLLHYNWQAEAQQLMALYARACRSVRVAA